MRKGAKMDIDEVLADLKETMRTFIDDVKLQRLSAQLLKRWYDAMVKEGFTDEQALQILCANPQLVKIN